MAPVTVAKLGALRIMIIEDDPDIADAFRRSIEHAGMLTSCASNGNDAMQIKGTFQPDIVLVDLGLPDTDGIVLIKWLVEQGDCGVIVVSGTGDDTDRVLSLELGADDYVSKPPNMREMIARIRAVNRRVGQRAVVEPEQQSTFSLGGIKIDCGRRTVHNASGERITLTAAAYAALERLFLAKGQVVSRDEISEAALHRPWRAEDRSVDQLIMILRQKLASDEDGHSLIQSIRGTGYLLRLAELHEP